MKLATALAALLLLAGPASAGRVRVLRPSRPSSPALRPVPRLGALAPLGTASASAAASRPIASAPAALPAPAAGLAPARAEAAQAAAPAAAKALEPALEQAATPEPAASGLEQLQGLAGESADPSGSPAAVEDSGRARFDGQQARRAAGPSAERLVEAYQDGRLEELGASAEQRRVLEAAADAAVRRALESANFKLTHLYGFFLGTRMYEAPELPGVLLKEYRALRVGGRSFYLKGDPRRGYPLAKQRLGGLFAETTVVEDVEITVDGRKRRIPWALVQQKVRMEGIKNYSAREYEVRLGMRRRGVVDIDPQRRMRNVEEIEHLRNLGEDGSGRLLHFDADLFHADEDTSEFGAEPHRRVPDPEPLREPIRQAQLAALGAPRP